MTNEQIEILRRAIQQEIVVESIDGFEHGAWGWAEKNADATWKSFQESFKPPDELAHKTPQIPYNTLIHKDLMTEAELFDHITRIIASPHTAIIEHDKRRAIQVFLCFDEYLIDNVPGYCEEGCEIDFGGYAAGVLDELEETK